MSDVVVVQADYLNPVHAQAVRDVLNHYAWDPMGAVKPYRMRFFRRCPLNWPSVRMRLAYWPS